MNNKIEKLIKQFAKLPRIGGRAAQRIVLALLQDKTGRAAALAAALADAAESVRPCRVCGCLTDSNCPPSWGGLSAKQTGGGSAYESKESLPPSPHSGDTPLQGRGELCEFCRDANRANGQLCIVRDLGDVWTLEAARVFRGRYHIIGGLLSGAAGTVPEDLNIATLPSRIADEKITEIIFALPNTLEGKTTQHYVINTISQSPATSHQPPITFTELASGVPLGGDLDYIDDGTLSLAFGGRKQI
ncbi:MAG: recombination protein RecR [Proteobacteria bacterium]|nr:recombination protein RecR [Pseudomonadota bacterium]